MKYWLAAITVFLVHTSNTFADSNEDEDSSEYGVVNGDVGTNCTCGYANKEDKRIVGGVEAKKNEWPMIAEISMEEEHLCGGAIVTKRHVITAAHCAFNRKSLDPLPYELMEVNVGIHYVIGEDAFTGGQRFTIDEFIPHPLYHYTSKTHDIAVILLNSEIDFTPKNVAPACLPLGNEKIIGDDLKVLGWGLPSYQSEGGTAVLMKVTIKAADHSACLPYYRNYNKSTNLCMHTPTKDSCRGDSGGPLLWRDPDTNRYVLAAVTSYGNKRCGSKPAVNANVMYFLPWIQSIISATGPTHQTCAKMAS